jgi:hypothetical protein
MPAPPNVVPAPPNVVPAKAGTQRLSPLTTLDPLRTPPNVVPAQAGTQCLCGDDLAVI